MPRTVAILVLALSVLSCADGEFLADDGPIVDWVAEASAPPTVPSSTTTTTAPPPPLRPTAGLTWANDHLEVITPIAGEVPSPEEAVTAVWAGGSGTDRYVQAARSDIALALPGLGFPSLVPEDSRFISSQLVFSLDDGRLAKDTMAAFGIWTVEPYTSPRDLAQRAVLLVGSDDVDRVALAIDPSQGCAWFSDRDFRSCVVGPDDITPAWWVETFEGRTLIWLDGTYRYELRGRGVDMTVIEAMARSMAPIAEFGTREEVAPEEVAPEEVPPDG